MQSVGRTVLVMPQSVHTITQGLVHPSHCPPQAQSHIQTLHPSRQSHTHSFQQGTGHSLIVGQVSSEPGEGFLNETSEPVRGVEWVEQERQMLQQQFLTVTLHGGNDRGDLLPYNLHRDKGLVVPPPHSLPRHWVPGPYPSLSEREIQSACQHRSYQDASTDPIRTLAQILSGR